MGMFTEWRDDEIAKLQQQLQEARAEVERRALEIENKQYTITCASEENQQLKESLAEARAENAALVAEFQRLADEPPTLEEIAADLDKIEMLEKELAERDKLIEQMIEALRLALAECWSTCCENEIRAALSAAERMEKK